MLDYNENEKNIKSQSFCTLNLFEELSSLEDKKKILDLPKFLLSMFHFILYFYNEKNHANIHQWICMNFKLHYTLIPSDLNA